MDKRKYKICTKESTKYVQKSAISGSEMKIWHLSHKRGKITPSSSNWPWELIKNTSHIQACLVSHLCVNMSLYVLVTVLLMNTSFLLEYWWMEEEVTNTTGLLTSLQSFKLRTGTPHQCGELHVALQH